MRVPEPTASEIRRRLVASARRIVADHEPVLGRCPVCRMARCEAAAVAAAYLAEVEGVAFA